MVTVASLEQAEMALVFISVDAFKLLISLKYEQTIVTGIMQRLCVALTFLELGHTLCFRMRSLVLFHSRSFSVALLSWSFLPLANPTSSLTKDFFQYNFNATTA